MLDRPLRWWGFIANKCKLVERDLINIWWTYVPTSIWTGRKKNQPNHSVNANQLQIYDVATINPSISCTSHTKITFKIAINRPDISMMMYSNKIHALTIIELGDQHIWTADNTFIPRNRSNANNVCCIWRFVQATGYRLTDVINRFSDLFGISKRKTCRIFDRISFYQALSRSTQEVIEIQNQNIDSMCQRSVKWFPLLTLYLDRNEPKDITTTNWQQKSEQVYGWHFGHSMKFNIELCTHKVPSVLFFFFQSFKPKFASNLQHDIQNIDFIQKQLMV